MRHLYSVFERTSNMCFYQYNGSYAVSGLFPNVTTLTLIKCNNIHNLIQTAVFPNLKSIHYLSGVPKEPIELTHNIKWILPSFYHPFYQTLHNFENGIGRVDTHLISLYVDSIRMAEDGVTDISLYIPDYGIIDGENYDYYLRQYFTKNNRKNAHFDEYYSQNITKTFMKLIHL